MASPARCLGQAVLSALRASCRLQASWLGVSPSGALLYVVRASSISCTEVESAVSACRGVPGEPTRDRLSGCTEDLHEVGGRHAHVAAPRVARVHAARNEDFRDDSVKDKGGRVRLKIVGLHAA